MPRLSLSVWALLALLMGASVGCLAPTFGADQKPLVINPTTGKQEQLQPGNNLTMPDASGDLVTINVGVQSAARTVSLPTLTGNSTLPVLEVSNVFTKNLYAGDGTAMVYLIANGSGIGSGGGSGMAVQNGSGNIFLFGNKSAIVGGAYDATPFMQSGSAGTATMEFKGQLSFSNTVASTSTTTGTLINAGGFGNAGAIYTGSLHIGDNTFMLYSFVALPNGAAANVGTLTNAPTAGNPTKWIPINDNGTTRYMPAW